jgi:sporulation protein YlmC with PRC-barrel domain
MSDQSLIVQEVTFVTVKTIVDGDDADKVPTLRKLRDTDQTISSSDEDIRGRTVKDKDGRDIGKIEGLMVDDVEQKVRFIEVATGGFLGFGETRSFIPVEAITRTVSVRCPSATPANTWPAHLVTTPTSSRQTRTTSSICTRTTDTRGTWDSTRWMLATRPRRQTTTAATNPAG